jgi:thiol:disulfide interchange protein DsbD
MSAIVAVGVLLGAVHRDFAAPGLGPKVAKGIGVLLTTIAGFLFIAGATTPERTLSWEKSDWKQAEARAKSEGRPLLIDFTASWCVACKEMDKLTFAAPDVSHEAGRFVAVKVDATDDEDPQVEAAKERFSVKGLPTVVIYDSEGKEAARYTEFVEADRFLEAIKRVN